MIDSNLDQIITNVNWKSIANSKYIWGLLITEVRKTCTRMGSKLGVSHDALYYALEKIAANISGVLSFPEHLVNHFASLENSGYLMIDDVKVHKLFGKLAEGLSYQYDTVMKTSINSYTIVFLCWTNGCVTIPLGIKIWYSKKTDPKHIHKTKIMLAQELVMKFKHVPFIAILFDGAYASKAFMDFLDNHQITFYTKLSKDTLVQEPSGQFKFEIQNHYAFKLKKNNRLKTFEAIVYSKTRYITIKKIKRSCNEFSYFYIISNRCETAKSYFSIYRLRWNIEMFFRTAKQSLGLQDCQSRLITNQIAHFSAVSIAFGIAELIKFCKKLLTPEDAIRYLQSLKSTHSLYEFVQLELLS